jgi:D-alanine-D-alanine ligase
MALRVGLLYNLKKEEPAAAEDDEPPDAQAELDTEATVLAVGDALRSAGHEVCFMEGDETLWSRLTSFRPDIAFNMCEGKSGRSRESHVPALLEMARIPYTGSDVLCLAVALEKPLSKKIWAYHGIPTPAFTVVPVGERPDFTHLRFPLFIKPAREGSSMGIDPLSKASDEAGLLRKVESIHRYYRQEALVEEYIDGREFTVGIMGNPPNEHVFPIMEIGVDRCPDPEHRGIYSRKFKAEWDDLEYYHCPAILSSEEELRIRSVAVQASRALGCRDVARVDIRLSREGIPYVLEVNQLPGLTPGFSDLPRMAEASKMTFEELVNGILLCAMLRYQMADGAPSFRKFERIA